jgi:hypothetical protein
MTSKIPEFPSFEALAKAHSEGRDFKRIIRPLKGANVAVIAPTEEESNLERRRLR